MRNSNILTGIKKMTKLMGAVLLVSTMIAAPPQAVALNVPAIAEYAPAAKAPEVIAIDERAIKLAQLLFTRETVQEQVTNSIEISLRQTLQNNPDNMALEAEYPGLTNVIISSLKPVMLEAYDAKLPQLWDSLSVLYTTEFTESELDQLLGFYTGPVGVRYMKSLRRNAGTTNTMDASLKAGGLDKTVIDAANRDRNSAIRKANAETTTADKLAIFRFENSAAGRKLLTIVPQSSKIQIEWDFYFTDEQRVFFAKTRSDAVADFVSKTDAARGKKSQ
jgi:Uncharacterized protein conserved in bacteria (DUF2059)